MEIELVAVLLAAVALLFLGMQIPFVIALAGVGCIMSVQGVAGLKAVGFVTWGAINNYTLTAIPLYVLMAEVLLRSGLAARLYRGLSYFSRRLPGGLLQSNILGCGFFSAISGSSVTTAATLGTVAIPELRARNYPVGMMYGSLAAGGTLGILIPPSLALIIYGTFSDVSIVKLFAAGLVPGIVLMILFMIYIGIASRFSSGDRQRQAPATSDPGYGPLQSLVDVAPTLALIVLVLGSLYAGLATPTEAAAVGCTIAIIIGAIWGRIDADAILESVRRAADLSVSILLIILAAYVLSFGVNITGVGRSLVAWVASLELSAGWFICVLTIVFFILGMLIESTAMIVIMVPLLLPIVAQYGIDPLWFGIYLVLMIEIGQITPPFGINIFVLAGLYGENYNEIVKGTVPYYLLLLFLVVMIYIFPNLVLWLPQSG